MEMMNRAIEDATDFRGMMDKMLTMRQATQGGEPEMRRYTAIPDRQYGENRADHRARLKRERREAKTRKVPT